jgi:flagellar basal body rod protein FlgG
MTNTPGMAGLGLLKQGCLERSNVQTANELLELRAIVRQAAALVRVLAPYGIDAP